MLKWIERLEAPNRPWFLWAMLFLNVLDYYVLVIPMDGLYISYILFFPKKWLRATLVMTLGAAIGGGSAMLLATKLGEAFIFEHFPKIMSTSMWVWSRDLLNEHGKWILFLFGLSPLAQLPAVLAAGLFHMAFLPSMMFYVTGRFAKNLILAQISVHAPQKLQKLWGMKSEIKEVKKLHLDEISPLESQIEETSTKDRPL